MRKSADAFAFQTMLLLCVIWGIQQVTIKWAATDIAPVMQAAIRSGIAAALVGLLMCWRGGWEGLRQGTLGAGLLTGTLFALEFLFIALGLQYTTASHMSVFLYTAPIFSALGLHFLLPSERLRPLQWLGVAVCFGGIAVAFGGGLSWAEMDGRMLLGDAFGLLAGMSWGATTVAVRGTRLSEAPPSLTLFYQLFVACAGLLLIALFSGQLGEVRWTPVSTASVLFQGVVVSFASYFCWFWLLRRYLANNLAIFSFMTPVRRHLRRIAAGRAAQPELRRRRGAGPRRHHPGQRRAVAATPAAPLSECDRRNSRPAKTRPSPASASAGCRPPAKCVLSAASSGPSNWPRAKPVVSWPALRCGVCGASSRAYCITSCMPARNGRPVSTTPGPVRRSPAAGRRARRGPVARARRPASGGCRPGAAGAG